MADNKSNGLAKADELANGLTSDLANDNEIIKALERCSKDGMINCHNCPYEESCNMGRSDMQKDALDLINRQKTEIEQWKEEANKYQSLWVSACTEAKSEAVREFAERLSGDLYKLPSGYKAQLRKMIDNLVKEMAGDTDER